MTPVIYLEGGHTRSARPAAWGVSHGSVGPSGDQVSTRMARRV